MSLRISPTVIRCKPYRFCFLAAFLSAAAPQPAAGWGEKTHTALAETSLAEIAHSSGLDQSIPIRPVGALLKTLQRAGIPVQTPEELALTLYINPLVEWHTIPKIERAKRTMSPLGILASHVNDPDDGRDKGIIKRDETGRPLIDPAGNFIAISPHQKWLAGVSSQAFRHMEKPPFSWRRPATTIGYPFGAVGEASRRVGLYYHLGLIAIHEGEAYWGWRMLASAFHHLQDLAQPYHTSQLTPPLFWVTIRQILGPLKEMGPLDAAVHIVGNQHRFYEAYIDRLILEPEGRRVLKKAAGEPLGQEITDPFGSAQGRPMKLAVFVRDTSNQESARLQGAIRRLSHPRLLGPEEFSVDKMPPDDPADFVLPPTDLKSLAAHHEMFEITARAFALAGVAQRRLVRTFLAELNRPDPTRWKYEVDQLRRPAAPL